MLDPGQFRTIVFRPTLERIGLGGQAAEVLLLGTALAETNLSLLAETGRGGGLGVYQIDLATHTGVWGFLRKSYKQRLRDAIEARAITGLDLESQLAGNLYYATAIARVRYWMMP